MSLNRLLAATCLGGLAAVTLPAQSSSLPIRLIGPDGRIEMRITVDETGRLHHSAWLGDAPAIEPSPFSIRIDGRDVSVGVETGVRELYSVDEEFPVRGVHAMGRIRCRGLRLPVQHQATALRYTLEARACSDGVAFRHLIPGEGERVPEEATSFVLPAGSRVWSHDFEGHYEGLLTSSPIEQVPPGTWAAPPLTVRLPGERGYLAVTESAVIDYAGMGLEARGGRRYQLRLGHAQPVSYPFRLRYAGDVERLSKPAAIEGSITTPWRVVLLGRTLDAMVNADLVNGLAPAPDPSVFPEGAATAWIRPGRAVWRYLDGGENTLAGMREFTDLAAELGFEYNLLEGFWQRWSDEQLRDLVRYSASRDVGIWVWLHSRDVRNDWVRRTAFEKLHALGVVGVKVDFFDHEAREVVNRYRDVLRDAAASQLMVNFHGASKPAGEPRTWPNELTREGVYGMEHRRTERWAPHNTALPFTRYLAGPGDYTPVIFGDRRKETSWAHQIATAAMFTSPLLVYGAHPRSLLESPAVEIIRSIPAAWDETRVLPMSRIGELAIMARRRGPVWFLVVLNGSEARQIRVGLDFLPAGQFEALAAGDVPADPARLRINRREVTAGTTLSLSLRAGGGFIARLQPAGGS